ncbi:MAG: hypothetical protein P1U32_02210 [Legionellaceae bacterium]|nr:hypothetical protein [Legionellaceae bacterium]
MKKNKNETSSIINEHFLWHYEAFGDTGGLDKETIRSALDDYLKQKHWCAVLTCLNMLEEVDLHMSKREKGVWHSIRGFCYSGLYEACEPGGSKEVFAREAQRQFDEAALLLGTTPQCLGAMPKP